MPSKTPRAEDAAVTLQEALLVGRELQKAGDLGAAQQVYERILAVAPEDADALHLLGMVHYQKGDPEGAILLIRRCLSKAADFADAHINLANILKITGRRDEAIAHYRAALELDPENANTFNNLGIVCREQGLLEEAAQAYEAALARDPDLIDTSYNLANLRLVQDRPEEAVALFRQVLTRNPRYFHAYRPLCVGLSRLGRREEALAVLQDWLMLAPDHPVALHLLAAHNGADPPARASDDYVRGLFASFAVTFDEHLARLRYRAPELVSAALGAQRPADRRLDVLDAGCGTGLSGVFLRPFARRLVGIDLSPEMLAKAEPRGLYDELVETELTAYLSAHEATFDLVACIDTLVYFGDLEAVMTAFSRGLRDGGLLAFTVERGDPESASTGYRLTPSGRYEHSDAFVRRSLEQAGLAPKSLEPAELRFEHGQAVAGLVVLAAKPD